MNSSGSVMDYISQAKTRFMNVYVSSNLRSAEQKKASFHLHLLPVCPRGTGGRCCHSQQWGKLIYDYAFKLIFLLCFCSCLLFFSIDLFRYGDVTPKSVPGRVFGIIWVLVGAVVMSLFTATIISDMQTAVDGTKCKDIEGKEVSVNFRITIIDCSSRAMRLKIWKRKL